MNTLEKIVVFDVTGGGFLVGVVTKDLLTVGTLNLVFCGTPAVFSKAEDLVMILSLS